MDDNTSSGRRKQTRTPDEMRDIVITFRLSRRELDELYRFARARKATMSYMIRQALKETYPDIFPDPNRHIRKPRKPLTFDDRTHILHSYVDGSIKVLDPKP